MRKAAILLIFRSTYLCILSSASHQSSRLFHAAIFDEAPGDGLTPDASPGVPDIAAQLRSLPSEFVNIWTVGEELVAR